MPDLSEFIAFVAEKSGIDRLDLVEKDLIIHRILREISSSHLAENYLFKGGSCLVKCYFGYYRFSVDLDFTWKNQKTWETLGKKQLRRSLLEETDRLGSLLENISTTMNLEFKNDPRNKRYFEFGGGSRMVTFKLWKNSELIKIQVNFVEEILFPLKKAIVKTLLNDPDLTKDERVYFEEFLGFYKSFQILAYDEREILCEKVRAILTRRAQKLRDFYDLFMLDKSGIEVMKLRKDVIKKTKASLRYEKYKKNLEKNRQSLEMRGILDDTFERSLFVIKPGKDFEIFIRKFIVVLKDIMNKIVKNS
jgi:predicted nucleotidyltransferase component of viral defense system